MRRNVEQQRIRRECSSRDGTCLPAWYGIENERMSRRRDEGIPNGRRTELLTHRQIKGEANQSANPTSHSNEAMKHVHSAALALASAGFAKAFVAPRINTATFCSAMSASSFYVSGCNACNLASFLLYRYFSDSHIHVSLFLYIYVAGSLRSQGRWLYPGSLLIEGQGGVRHQCCQQMRSDLA